MGDGECMGDGTHKGESKAREGERKGEREGAGGTGRQESMREGKRLREEHDRGDGRDQDLQLCELDSPLSIFSWLCGLFLAQTGSGSQAVPIEAGCLRA